MEASAQTDPFGLVGTVLERKYRVDRVVAEGGFGIVYAGHHLALDLPVAVKVLKRRPEVDNDAWHDLLARFVQEAQTMARLRHPNVVTVLDTGVAQTDGGPLPWMVLEWLDGVTLKDDLAGRRGRGGRPTREALDLLRPVVQAVAEAHHSRVAHRDLKPTNVMLVPTRRGGISPRVLDFGIAKIMEGDARASSGHTTTDDAFRAFSLGYAAPEQIAGARTGPWTDVHALGLILTEVLVDAAPYSDEPTEQHARAFGPVRPTPARFGVDVGPLEAVIARAVALKPADRFQDAGELLAAIESTAVERTSPVPVVREHSASDATSPTLARPLRRGALVTWTALGVVAAGAGLAVAAARFGGDRANAAPAPSASAGPTARASAPAQPPASAVTQAPPQPTATVSVPATPETAPSSPAPRAVRTAGPATPPGPTRAPGPSASGRPATVPAASFAPAAASGAAPPASPERPAYVPE